MIKDLGKDIPLPSLTGVIGHLIREKPTYTKGEGRPRAILTSILLYLVNQGFKTHWKRQRQDSAASLL